MRARNVKPGFFSNESLAGCAPLARILFVGLWCMADKNGLLEDRPQRIKALALPFDECDCERLLGELASADLIHRYEADGRKCIWIPKFKEHQSPHPNEKETGLPPCSGNFRELQNKSSNGLPLPSSLNPSFRNPEVTPSGGAASPPPAACRKPDDPEPTGQADAPSRPRKPRRQPTGVHAECVRAFCDRWEAKYGAVYPFDGGKDAEQVQAILKHLGNDAARFAAVVALYLDDPDPWFAKDRHSLGVLRSQLRKFVAAEQRKPLAGIRDFASKGAPAPGSLLS